MCQCDFGKTGNQNLNLNLEAIGTIIKCLLVELHEDPEREGLRDTPQRAATSYTRILSGYGRSLADEMTVFENENGYDDIIYSGKINFFSTCEHHLLPFFGTAHIGYIPDKKIIGLSKLARAVDIFSRRLQNQENITTQIANEIYELANPQGIAVLLEGQHFCNMARGVEQVNSNMKTLCFKGVFKDNAALSDRFLAMTK